jgi:hypothetical protein
MKRDDRENNLSINNNNNTEDNIAFRTSVVD